jgi:copper(I)-binding protein
MKYRAIRSLSLSLPLLLAAAIPAIAVADAAGDVMVMDPYVRAVPPGQKNSAAFMKLHNGSGDHHAVVGAQTDAANMAELHTHINEGGMMKMRKVEKFDIHPNSETVLQPGGDHVMLMGLKGDLNDGDHAMITLVFEDGSKKVVHAPVRKLDMKMDMEQKGQKHGHMH